MIIEIVGTGFSNKGAQLMLAAIVDRLSQTIPEIQFAADPSIGPYQQRARYGLLQRFDANKAGRLGWIRERLFHSGYQRRFGLVTERDVAAILDASGFALGDAWPEALAHSKSSAYKRWRSQGKKIVLLPQAMGPFQRKSTHKSYEKILQAADLIFARDVTSLSHARELLPNHLGLKLARDFTNLTLGTPTQVLGKNKQCGAIVPNAMMIRHKSQETQAMYVSFLARCADHLRQLGIEPYILLYETTMDPDLAEDVRQNIVGDIHVLVEEDPIKLKGITGKFLLMIGSRFHGLVNALSQGVPAIGTSWSHKYQALFDDYGRSNWLIQPSIAIGQAKDLISEVVETHASQRKHLLSYKDQYEGETENMWRQVEALFVHGSGLNSDKC